jgi:hypothetical protein
MTISRVFTLHLSHSGLFNISLLHMEKVNNHSLLVLSQFGDLFKISQLDHFENPSFHKYYQIFRLFEPKDYYRTKQDKILILSGPFLYSIDCHEKELCQLEKYDCELEKVA